MTDKCPNCGGDLYTEEAPDEITYCLDCGEVIPDIGQGGRDNPGRVPNRDKGLPTRKRVNIGLYPKHIEFAAQAAEMLGISRDAAVREALERLAKDLGLTSPNKSL